MKILEFITSFISIPNSIFVDEIIGTVVLTVSSSAAYKVGGWLGFKGKSGFIGWLFLAATIYTVLSLIIKCIIWLIQNPIYLILGTGAVAIIGICLWLMIRSAHRSQRYD